MWGVNVMLRKKQLLSLFSLSFVLSSCGKSTYLFGLVPGIYYFQSVEGVLPSGWSFDSTSYFEFKKSKISEKDFNEKTDLLKGQWNVNYYNPNANGEGDTILNNYIIQWYNTPFDNLSPIMQGGTYTDGSWAALVMYDGKYEDNEWPKYINHYSTGGYVKCKIKANDKKDTSKRTFVVSVCFSEELVGKADRTEITFSA